jgi:hypothetical protein
MGNWYTEESAIVSCQPLTVRIPQSLVVLQNSTTSDRIIAGVVSDGNRSGWRSVRPNISVAVVRRAVFS